MKTIALAGGGTAGHIMPHIAAIPYLEQKFSRIIYFSSGKVIEKKLFSATNVEIFDIHPPALSRSITPQNLLIPAKLLKAVREAEDVLIKTHTDLVFSKGGYCALPVCLAAKKLNIPYVCHESDLSMGLANKLTYKKSSLLLTVFPETAKKYGGICVGPPLREDLKAYDKKKAKKLLGIDDKKPLLLVTGGSQGSATINNALAENLTVLLKKYYVIHLYGNNNKPAYKSINGYFPLAFGDMKVCMPACDICLSRGGSNTLFELLYSGVPSIIVPLKKASRGDQQKNAEYFQRKNAIFVCDEKDLIRKLPFLCDSLIDMSEEIKKNISALNITNGTRLTAEYLFKLI